MHDGEGGWGWLILVKIVTITRGEGAGDDNEDSEVGDSEEGYSEVAGEAFWCGGEVDGDGDDGGW